MVQFRRSAHVRKNGSIVSAHQVNRNGGAEVAPPPAPPVDPRMLVEMNPELVKVLPKAILEKTGLDKSVPRVQTAQEQPEYVGFSRPPALPFSPPAHRLSYWPDDFDPYSEYASHQTFSVFGVRGKWKTDTHNYQEYFRWIPFEKHDEQINRELGRQEGEELRSRPYNGGRGLTKGHDLIGILWDEQKYRADVVEATAEILVDDELDGVAQLIITSRMLRPEAYDRLTLRLAKTRDPKSGAFKSLQYLSLTPDLSPEVKAVVIERTEQNYGQVTSNVQRKLRDKYSSASSDVNDYIKFQNITPGAIADIDASPKERRGDV